MNLKNKLKLSTRPGVTTTLEPNGDNVIILNEHRVPGRQIDQIRAKASFNARRAPMGDSSGAWQWHGEMPLALVLKYIPAHAMEDWSAWQKLFNSAEFRNFTSGRRL